MQQQSGTFSKTVDIWTVQCAECFKWRVIPTQEEYEEIRSKVIEEPFVCSKMAMGAVSCNNAADIELNNSRTWLIDKPNLPKTPAGFKRRVVMRKDGSRLDCYYNTPNGKVLRSLNEVPTFLDKNQSFKKYASVRDFSFICPKMM
ncbi:methyl-CPG-binding domain 1 [Perilla frutescens var. hirtella]|uniref:Methyl-CPG-binding domain 1 n=1 Tax=Perilla frutescens var. hirtella TaxID=608512 RepID=A0AAD4P646_PERFH|nr:methyl-CPG-binding domain 1 [Perilla frutescens var. hirtella]